MKWNDVKEKLPSHIYSVVIWVVGGRLHFGEDYIDVGIYNHKEKRWQANAGNDDDIVQVSHWFEAPSPVK